MSKTTSLVKKSRGKVKTSTIKRAWYSGEDEDTTDKSIRMKVNLTDDSAAWIWFPVKEISPGKDGQMICPRWLVDEKNADLHKRGYRTEVRIALVPGA